MKKIITLALAAILLFALSACSNSESSQPSSEPSTSVPSTTPEETDDTDEAAAPSNNGDGNILIAYFTNPEPDGVDAVARASRVVADGEVVGNTQFIAQIIQNTVGGDLFAIETVEDYPARPDLMDIAADERSQNARPELSSLPQDLDSYDVIFLGYPNWNADMPMALYTFLESVDLSGKTIIPFCPHGGSGLSRSESTIAELQPGAIVSNNSFTVSREAVPSSEGDIIAWLESLNLAE